MMTETAVTVTTGHPQQAHPHPTVKTDPGQSPGSLSWLRINIDYFKTLPGILKLVQAVSARGRRGGTLPVSPAGQGRLVGGPNHRVVSLGLTTAPRRDRCAPPCRAVPCPA
ncbi:hypothetical protein ONE63_000711 [Megalurothrips usitatus]|uniref:Uncharacterized protein n=1 Tax=Megalurothrips usitatus TaxID=439358 RepID=A0AAV7Y2T6_9NEOP|nr:hypothetical protein ONE63_000711 [Megalurothrips usitatus]